MIKAKPLPHPEFRNNRTEILITVLRNVTPVTKPKGGRPKRYETAAERQAAYRARKKTND